MLALCLKISYFPTKIRFLANVITQAIWQKCERSIVYVASSSKTTNVLKRWHFVELVYWIGKADWKWLLQLRAGLHVTQDLVVRQLLSVLNEANHWRKTAAFDDPEKKKLGSFYLGRHGLFWLENTTTFVYWLQEIDHYSIDKISIKWLIIKISFYNKIINTCVLLAV